MHAAVFDSKTAQIFRCFGFIEIDQFSGVDFQCPVTPADLKAVLAVPEEKVKNSLADLIGEAYVPKDWGGERSDLYTSRVFARGRQISR